MQTAHAKGLIAEDYLNSYVMVRNLIPLMQYRLRVLDKSSDGFLNLVQNIEDGLDRLDRLSQQAFELGLFKPEFDCLMEQV